MTVVRPITTRHTSRSRSTVRVGAFAAGAMFAMTACNYTPISRLESSLTLEVRVETGSSERVPIDFLWVIDNSTSMCEEQNALAENFTAFRSSLDAFFDIDARVAVVTHDVQCDPDEESTSKGIFNRQAATLFGRTCGEVVHRVCEEDSECVNLDCDALGQNCDGNQGEWLCDQASPASCSVNPNGTLNSSCVRQCASDAECQTVFESADYKCTFPGTVNSACVRQPTTAGCPAELPAFLDSDNLDLFPCLATVGVRQDKCLKFEQGMAGSLLALAPDRTLSDDEALISTLRAQSETFLRDEAYLVVIYVSDEDDCSITTAASIFEDDYPRCALLNDSRSGGPLIPVSDVANVLKGLKSEPSKVIVAAIAGDSTEETPADVAADRAAYLESKADARDCHKTTSICTSSNGKADFGSRYLELTESFGPHGVFENICGENGIGPALERIAGVISQAVNLICLPRPVVDGLVVTRVTADGETVVNEGTGDDDYTLGEGGEACLKDGVPRRAIRFNRPPTPGERYVVTYEGDPGVQ